MWSLQRPNKAPDKKWRLNKESKYSSVLRSKDKKKAQVERTNSMLGTPYMEPYVYPYDPRVMTENDFQWGGPVSMDPRLINRPQYYDQNILRGPRGINSINQGPKSIHTINYDPRSINPNLDQGPRIINSINQGPRNVNSNLKNVEAWICNSAGESSAHESIKSKESPPSSNPSSTENENNRSRSMYPRPTETKTNYQWPKRPLKPENTSSESDEEIYRKVKTKPGWISHTRTREASLSRGIVGMNKVPKPHYSEMDLTVRAARPLQELNGREMKGQEVDGREKHVERFLASIEKNSTVPAQQQQPQKQQQPPEMEVVSRQRILSRSRDDLNECEDEDVWFDLDQLVKEHIHEILKKWEQIDDGIWAKVIVFEKNRRVAKAYVRPPILTVNGSDVGFDGHRIGLRGFDNPMRDAKTLEVISRYVGPGVKIRMDNKGNIEVKKMSPYSVYAKPLGDENAINDEIIKTPNMTLDSEKQMVFDIKKFEQNVNREVRRPYPNRAKLENQCIMTLAFSKPSNILQCSSWVMIINIVAMDMLRSRLPIGLYVKVPNIKNRPRLPVPEEDPYSITGSSSGASSGKEKTGKDKPPKLPPRDTTATNKNNSKADYDSPEESVFKRFQLTRKNNSKEKDRKYDDPYYCGLRARIPNFVKQTKKEKSEPKQPTSLHTSHSQYQLMPSQHQMVNQAIFHQSQSVDSNLAKMQHLTPYPYKFERNPCSFMPPQQVGYATDWEHYWVS